MTDATSFPQQHSIEAPSVNRLTSPLRWLGRSLTSAPEFQLFRATSPDRDKVENYIAKQFHAVYSAKISNFMPFLLTMNCFDEISATAGMRPATAEPLFLEQYLAQPVEQRITDLLDTSVERQQIVEIGNLAATRRGSSQLLFLLLTGLLYQTQFQWIVFTGNNQVARSLQRLGIELHNLGDADPEQLTTDNQSDWGSYYQGNPHVFCANIPQGKLAMDNSKTFSAAFQSYQATINSLALSVNRDITALNANKDDAGNINRAHCNG